MEHPNKPDEITKAVCGWLLRGGEEGAYSGPDPGESHSLSALLSKEIGSEDLYLAATASWFRLEQTLLPVLNRIKNSGARIWVMKGFDFALSLYPFPGARPMCDADLFVEKQYFQPVLNAFRSLGWNVLTPGDGVFTAGIVSEIKMLKPRAMAEIHSHIFYFPATFPGRMPADLFSNGRPLAPGLKGFEWHNALLLCLLHMLTNTSIKPVWWVDTCLLCAKVTGAGSWKKFAWNAQGTGLGKPLASLLAAATECTGAPVPDSVLQALCACESGRENIIGKLKSGSKIPTLLNLIYLPGWKRISWMYALMWLILTGQHPVRRG